MPPSILVIEDDEGAADLAAAVLRQEGYEVLLAADGKKGLELAQKNLPALIVVDLMLPAMHGFAVCERLREADNKARILVVSSKAYTQDRDGALSAGADDYLVKPYRPEELAARVRALLGGGPASGGRAQTPASPA